MKLPSKATTTGQVLRLMLDGKARSKLDITEALGLHPAKEVTARLRDFRKDAPDGYCLDVQKDSERRNGQTVYVYWIVLDVAATPLIEAMRPERRKREEMGAAA